MSRYRAELGDPGGGGAASHLAQLYEAHYLPLLKLCVLLVGRSEGAEDLVQEAFTRAARHLLEVDADQARSYLRATALNLFRNRLRRSAIERKHHNAGADSYEMDLDARQEMWRAVRRLPARQRAVVVLRYYEDLSERETAEVLGCSIGTVKSQNSRALKRLRKEVGYEA